MSHTLTFRAVVTQPIAGEVVVTLDIRKLVESMALRAMLAGGGMSASSVIHGKAQLTKETRQTRAAFLALNNLNAHGIPGVKLTYVPPFALRTP